MFGVGALFKAFSNINGIKNADFQGLEPLPQTHLFLSTWLPYFEAVAYANLLIALASSFGGVLLFRSHRKSIPLLVLLSWVYIFQILVAATFAGLGHYYISLDVQSSLYETGIFSTTARFLGIAITPFALSLFFLHRLRNANS